MEHQEREVGRQGLPYLERYPISIRITSNLIIVYMLVAGFLGLFPIRFWNRPVLSYGFLAWAVFSLVYLLRKQVCTHCYYYGKWCHTGWGKITGRLFPKRDEETFKQCLAYPKFFWGAFATLPVLAMAGFLGYQYVTKQLLSTLSIVMAANYLVAIYLNMSYNTQTGCLLCKMRSQCIGGRWAEKRIKPETKAKTRSKYLSSEP